MGVPAASDVPDVAGSVDEAPADGVLGGAPAMSVVVLPTVALSAVALSVTSLAVVDVASFFLVVAGASDAASVDEELV